MNIVKQTLVFRAARKWLATEPGDKAADAQVKLELVEAGLLPDTNLIIRVVASGKDDTTIQVVTERFVITVDTAAETMKVKELPSDFTYVGIDNLGRVVF